MRQYLMNLFNFARRPRPGWRCTGVGVFTRDDGCQASRVNENGKRVWMVMVPGSDGPHQPVWQALQDVSGVRFFARAEDAMKAAEFYLGKCGKRDANA